ncbi:cytochrome B [Corticibacter populi]|uniref:Cytochrome B n=1 Tax=Corticibacter populi TaxID=1550736 RepID=A0A3M6QM72_9BURK|nr:cytochrome b/b6 domain-containing protein [Corticibacter populi]RMX04147.1 cytochrome B [Corticibacter populi]RZS33160.1 cytochrome b [Corticibacter populi]
MSKPNMHKMRVWDLPTRLFHWALFVLMTLLFVTAYAGRMDAHAAMGQAVWVLVVFRLAWGFIGSQTARFSDFAKGPSAIRSYLATGQSRTLGHNPLGAAMVLALLATILVQALSGMFSSNGIGFDAPFAHLISRVASDSVTSLHVTLAYVIAGLVAIHIAAVLLHWMLRGENLIVPMFSGKKSVQSGTSELRFTPAAAAFAIVVAAAVLLALARKFI